ncbi:hypothetical protein [Actinoplanes regularis]|uniref:hypothetical protein n=1 Tax=Actinoplanes regularis TaxID=52697 RepID=UPI0025538714|nr:hypothetical protein [Actinoplanes regularis]
MINLLLLVVGPFLVVGLTALPAVIQWPIPASAPSRRTAFFGLQPAGGGWR